MIPEWKKIIECPSQHVGKKVHVDGWNIGCVFILDEYDVATGTAYIRTRVSNKQYQTKQPLFYLRESKVING